MMGMNVIRASVTVGAVILLLSGCKPSVENQLLSESGLSTEDAKFYPSDEYIRMGKVHFRNRDYGMAEQNFRKATEVTPTDAEAWLGLAASYDQLRRFDLADNAYAKLLTMQSRNAVIYNNAGYSHLLRGNTERARYYLLKANELDPNNPYIAHNIELLGQTSKTVKRASL
jgi:Flp pilus assembly protein TadD